MDDHTIENPQAKRIARLEAALEVAMEILREASSQTSGPLFLRIAKGLETLREAKWAAPFSDPSRREEG